MYQDQELTIRQVLEKDLERLWELIYKDEQPEWKKWDAPYYPHKAMPYKQFIESKRDWIGDESSWVIEVNGIVEKEHVAEVLNAAYRTQNIENKEMVSLIPIDFGVVDNDKVKDPLEPYSRLSLEVEKVCVRTSWSWCIDRELTLAEITE